jgi:4-amino-4-deoxy-L-arabinose transferase-like glycosyltransferase
MALIFLFVLLVAALLRGYQLATPSYWMDEGFSINTAQQFWQQFTWVRSPLYHSLLGLVGWASHWNIWALRGVSVVLGLLMIAAGYYAAKRWFNERTALWFSILLAVVSLEVAWSRQVRMYILLQLCIWLALYCYYQWRHHQLKWYWLVLFILTTIGSHEFGWMVFLFIVWYECLQRFKVLYPLVVVGSLVVVYIGYHIVFPNAPYINYWWQYWHWMLTNYSLLLSLAALGIATHPQYSKLLNWLVIVWVGWVVCLSFIVPLLQYRYLFMTFPILLLLSALGLHWLWKQHWAGRIIVCILLGIMIWQHTITVIPQAFYPLESDSVSSPFAYKSVTPQPNFQAGYQFVHEYQTEHPDTQVATPYGELFRLYSGHDPDQLIFLNLTGGEYSDIPSDYNEASLATGGTLLFVDEFAEWRMDPAWKELPKELLWEDRNEPWSIMRVYRIL